MDAITPSEVIGTVRRFKKGSAPGGSGLSATHLRELLEVPTLGDDHNLAGEFAALTTKFAKGQMNRALAPWFAGARLTPLKKRDAGVRPVAVGETLRRVISSILTTRVRDRARENPAPLQVGVAISGGCEAMEHPTRRVVRRLHEDPTQGLLKIDLKNAFNLVNRNSFLAETRQHLPELYKWTEYCYAEDHPHLWVGDWMLRSVLGAQQGDPLGPLLFALALQPILTRLQEHLEDKFPHGTNMLCFYLDDGLIIGKHTVLVEALQFLGHEEVKSHGLHLSPAKCEVWWPTAPDLDTRAVYTPEVRQCYSAGTDVLQSPVGTTGHVRAAMAKAARDAQGLMSAVADLPDMHVALTLLRHCASSCQLMYLLRTVPVQHTRCATHISDSSLATFLRNMSGGVFPDTIFSELTLPMKSASPSFGIGLTLTDKIASSAFLGSSVLVKDLIPTLTSVESVRPGPSDCDVRTAYADWTVRVMEPKPLHASASRSTL